MITRKELSNLLKKYMIACNNAPTRNGLGIFLGVSGQTIRNAINGTFNGFLYTDKPHKSRAFSNDSFELIKMLFPKNKN